jgi:glycosyltransferase involved in cell wall biosynthesis
MKILITSPSLDTNHNISGISSLTRFIINYNTENEYIHFELGRKDGEKRNLFWFFRILKTYFKWFNLLLTQRGILIHFNLALSKPSIIRDSPLIMIVHLFRKDMIIHIHGGEFLMQKKNPAWMNCLLRLVFSGKNPIIVLSPLEAKVLQQNYSCKKIFVLPNCIGLKEATEFCRLYPENEILMLLFLGRISLDKGIEYILQAMELLKKKEIKFKFIMAGKGPEEISFIQKFNDLLGKDFEYKGVVSGNEKIELLKKCNVFLLPSFFEGLPMALIESMSFGLVPITTNVGSIDYVVNNGLNGIIINTHSSEEIASAIEILSKDKEYMQNLSKNAHQSIFNNFNPADYIIRLNEIYHYG